MASCEQGQRHGTRWHKQACSKTAETARPAAALVLRAAAPEPSTSAAGLNTGYVARARARHGRGSSRVRSRKAPGSAANAAPKHPERHASDVRSAQRAERRVLRLAPAASLPPALLCLRAAPCAWRSNESVLQRGKKAGVSLVNFQWKRSTNSTTEVCTRAKETVETKA